MKIKSTEDLKKLFDILDDGDTIIVSNEDFLQLEPGTFFFGGNLSYPAYENIPKIDTRTLSYGGKTIFVSVQENQDILMDFEIKGEKHSFSKNKYKKEIKR